MIDAQIDFHDIWLSPSDFDDSLRDEVAFTIAFASNVYCPNRQAALEMLRGFADDIIQTVHNKSSSNVGGE